MERLRHPLLVATIAVSAAYLLMGTRSEPPRVIGAAPDVLVHGVGYAVLGTLTAATAAAWKAATPAVLGWGYTVAHGALLELLQLFAPTRTTDWRDLLIDALGAGIGVLPWWLRRRR